MAVSDLPQPQPPDGAAPVEQDPKALYGQNYEKLPQDLRDALLQLISKFEKENLQPRTEEVRIVQRNREYEKGNQNIWWSATDKRWNTVGSNGVQTAGDEQEELARYDFVENIVGAHSQIAQSVLSQNPPHGTFLPQDPGSAEDIATAKAAKDVANFISDNNKLDERQAEVARYYFTDGVCLSYTHWEANADKYGVNLVPKIELMDAEISPAMLHCEQCGYEEPAPTPDAESAMPAMPEACPDCGAPMTPENVKPPVVGQVPQVTGYDEYPKGQERIEYLGALECPRPYFARNLEECPWIAWETEAHKSWVKSVYPEAAKIAPDQDRTAGVSENAARQARITLMATSYGRTGTDSWGSLVTLRRYWIRPWAFVHADDDSLTQRLTELYPDGAYVVFAGSTYCESANERLDKRWAIGFARKGDGMIRPALCEGLIDIQRRLNAEENITTETFERGISTRFINDNVIDFDAYIDAGALVCNDFPVTLAPNEDIRSNIFTTEPVRVSDQMTIHSNQLRGPVAEMQDGLSPALYGGDTRDNHTATGISIVKDSALGRIALPKRSMNDFYASTMLNAIDCFKENRAEDVLMSVVGPTAAMDSKIIHLEDLRGNCYARTGADESYPMSILQKRQLAMDMMASPNPSVQAAMTHPSNSDALKALLSFHDFKIPGEDSRHKQFREIRKMIETGQMIAPDVLLDDHQTEQAACAEWANSEEGQQYVGTPIMELVRQHMMAHITASAQQQAILADPQAAMGRQPAAAPAGEDMSAQGVPGQANMGSPAAAPAQVQ